MSQRLFPGDRRVWVWSLVAIVPMLGLIGYSLLAPRSFYTSTDSVGARSIVANLAPGHTLCVPNVPLAAGTGAVQFETGAARGSAGMSVTAAVHGRVLARGAINLSATQPFGRATVPLSPVLPARPGLRIGTVCIHVTGSGSIALAGFAGVPSGEQAPTLDGEPTASSVAMWLLPPNGQKRSLVGSWSSIMRRLTLFRPAFAGRVFYWLLFLAGIPLLSYFGLRLLAIARQPGRRLALGLALVTFAGAAMWAVTTAAFDAPDDSEHFEYTESLAERGQAPAQAADPRHPLNAYAADETLALGAVHHFEVIEVGDARPPWFGNAQDAWRALVAAQHPARDDGGGTSTATAVHSPLYYSLLIPGYALGRSGGIFSELFWMRITSALLAAVVVVAAFLTVRELVPSRPELAVATALIIAFQPMFTFIAGAVNNDNGVNAMAALAVFLTVRALKRGLTWRSGLVLGVVLGVLPLMKGTGLALFPPIALALVALVLWKRSRPVVEGVAAAAGGFLAVTVAWATVAGSFHRSVFGVPAGTGLGGGHLTSKLTYLWEVFLPRLPFMADHFASGFWPAKFIYVQRGFAGFGWYAIFFPNWVYDVIILVMALAGAAALDMAIRRRELIKRHWREAAFLVLVILAVIAGVETAYYSPTPRLIPLTPEQGRYAFTAIVPLAALALAGSLRLSRRSGAVVLSVMVACMVCFAAASRLLYLVHTFM
jgi:hypothetical protein